jgi:aldehyde:ferredoxin oxidoreductase
LFGGVCEIADFGQIMYLNDICDRLGIDTMTAANLAGLAIEACNRGLIDLGLDYGDSEGVGEFLESIVYRRGLGDMFADGILRVEKELGLEGVAVHVKGMEPAGYDPRKLKGMGLGYITASRGACHLRGTFYKPELAGYIDPATLDGKAEMYVDWEDRLCVMDCLIYCRFYRDLAQWPYITAVVNAAIGTDYSIEELREVASRITTESHVFNERRGFGPAQERLPAWLTERATDDEAHLSVTEAEMQRMRHEYYALRGWGTPED